ncbi:hypothetical protein [Streptomyces sp. NPDC090445]
MADGAFMDNPAGGPHEPHRRDIDHAIAYPEPPTSPVRHRHWSV